MESGKVSEPSRASRGGGAASDVHAIGAVADAVQALLDALERFQQTHPGAVVDTPGTATLRRSLLALVTRAAYVADAVLRDPADPRAPPS